MRGICERTALLLFRNRGLTAEQQFVKRLMDIVFSLLGLVLASPFMLVIAILVKAYDSLIPSTSFA